MPWLPFHTLTSSWLTYFPCSLWLWHRSLRNGWLLTSPCLSISELCGAWFAEVFGSVESGWKRCTTRVDVDSFEKFLKFRKKTLSRGHLRLIRISQKLRMAWFKLILLCSCFASRCQIYACRWWLLERRHEIIPVEMIGACFLLRQFGDTRP